MSRKIIITILFLEWFSIGYSQSIFVLHIPKDDTESIISCTYVDSLHENNCKNMFGASVYLDSVNVSQLIYLVMNRHEARIVYKDTINHFNIVEESLIFSILDSECNRIDYLLSGTAELNLFLSELKKSSLVKNEEFWLSWAMLNERLQNLIGERK